MKVLMKKIGGAKKTRMWNMAQFQPRRWHREQEALKAAGKAPDPLVSANPEPSVQPGTSGPLSPVEQAVVGATSPLAEKELEPAQPVPPAPSEQGTNGSPATATRASDAPSVSLPDPFGVAKSNPSSDLCDLGTLAVKPAARARVGKIARLPHDARETVNNMLRGGFRYKDIADYLAHRGYSGISENNISFWKYHGYMDWLVRQHELEARAHLVKSFEHCTRALDTDRVQQNAIAFAAEQLSHVMAVYDNRNILNLLNNRPELFPKFVESMALLSRCSNDLAKSFAANQASDAVVRAEMKANPITESLSEPISEADLDAEEESAASADVADSHSPANAPAASPVSGGHSTPGGQRSTGSPIHNGHPDPNGTSVPAGPACINGPSRATSEASLGNSKQFQATTTIPASSSNPTPVQPKGNPESATSTWRGERG